MVRGGSSWRRRKDRSQVWWRNLSLCVWAHGINNGRILSPQLSSLGPTQLLGVPRRCHTFSSYVRKNCCLSHKLLNSPTSHCLSLLWTLWLSPPLSLYNASSDFRKTETFSLSCPPRGWKFVEVCTESLFIIISNTYYSVLNTE